MVAQKYSYPKEYLKADGTLKKAYRKKAAAYRAKKKSAGGSKKKSDGKKKCTGTYHVKAHSRKCPSK